VEEMTAHMAQRVSGFKMPQSISLLDSIPKSDRGKVSKDGLLQIWRSQVNQVN
jgi:acyl-CoA synthetase (AMP-forming)/AMP-acid ligase II